MMDVDGEEPNNGPDKSVSASVTPEPDDGVWTSQNQPFTIKKFNPLFFWSWDVHSDNCAICRVVLMEPCLNCQATNNEKMCVVVWGDCNHAFHNCCMSLWLKNSATSKCPLCQVEWTIQRCGN